MPFEEGMASDALDEPEQGGLVLPHEEVRLGLVWLWEEDFGLTVFRISIVLLPHPPSGLNGANPLLHLSREVRVGGTHSVERDDVEVLAFGPLLGQVVSHLVAPVSCEGFDPPQDDRSPRV